MDRFVEELKKLAQEHTQVEIAAKAGLTQPTVSRLLTTTRGGHRRTVQALIRAWPQLGPAFLSDNIPD